MSAPERTDTAGVLFPPPLAFLSGLAVGFGLQHFFPLPLLVADSGSEALAAMYAEDAVNHQVAEAPVEGREAIRARFTAGFATADMVCLVENLFEEGEWGMLEWRDPLGLRGCGFFHVVDGQIVFQRGYWDKLTFLCQHGLPIPGN